MGENNRGDKYEENPYDSYSLPPFLSLLLGYMIM
jgi:hypothetical protein